MLEWLFGKREKPAEKVHIVVELRVSGKLELSGEGLGKVESAERGPGRFSDVSISEPTARAETAAQSPKRAEPTISPDFFADDGSTPDDFGKEV